MDRAVSDTVDAVGLHDSDHNRSVPGPVDPPVTSVRTFEAFYREDRRRLVRTLALHVGDAELAAEAVDVAMSRAWQRWSDLDDHDDAGAWVYRVARNWVSSWFRKRRWLARTDIPTRPVLGGQDRVDHRDQLAPAMAGLADKYHEVVVLRVLTGFSVTETATALDIPEGTVKSRLARALDQLRTALEEQR